MIRVGILDDHFLILKGIEELLDYIPSCTFLAGYQSIAEATEKLKYDQPDILLLDINLPDGDGIAYCKKVKNTYPDMKILALSSYDQPLHVKRMIANGASGYILKNTDIECLKNALEAVAAGEIFIQEQIKQDMSEQFLGLSKNKYIEIPTPREKEILELIANGFTSNEIADKLFISLNTVETHRRNLISKFQARNMAEMIRIAVTSGFLE